MRHGPGFPTGGTRAQPRRPIALRRADACNSRLGAPPDREFRSRFARKSSLQPFSGIDSSTTVLHFTSLTVSHIGTDLSVINQGSPLLPSEGSRVPETLQHHTVEVKGLEPSTYGLQSRRSSS